jgi:hypothetical protein
MTSQKLLWKMRHSMKQRTKSTPLCFNDPEVHLRMHLRSIASPAFIICWLENINDPLRIRLDGPHFPSLLRF